jgi:hypothetical protein
MHRASFADPSFGHFERVGGWNSASMHLHRLDPAVVLVLLVPSVVPVLVELLLVPVVLPVLVELLVAAM